MAKKKSILIETTNQGRTWTVKITCADRSLYVDLASYIRQLARDYECVLLNTSDPFGAEKKPRVKKVKVEAAA